MWHHQEQEAVTGPNVSKSVEIYDYFTIVVILDRCDKMQSTLKIPSILIYFIQEQSTLFLRPRIFWHLKDKV